MRYNFTNFQKLVSAPLIRPQAANEMNRLSTHIVVVRYRYIYHNADEKGIGLIPAQQFTVQI